MNLYERLKEEHKLKLEDVKESLPYSTQGIIEELQSAEFVRALPYGVVTDLYVLLQIDITEIINPWQLFYENN
jgi:hypothetical protein